MELKEQQYVSNFGKNLRKLRKTYRLSQEQLANDANIPINQIGRIERGEIGTSLNTLHRIATALNLPVKALFNFEEGN